jgi:hypothetical protein
MTKRRTCTSDVPVVHGEVHLKVAGVLRCRSRVHHRGPCFLDSCAPSASTNPSQPRHHRPRRCCMFHLHTAVAVRSARSPRQPFSPCSRRAHIRHVRTSAPIARRSPRPHVYREANENPRAYKSNKSHSVPVDKQSGGRHMHLS